MSPAILILGRYRLQEQIAAGGMGEVWRGVDTVLERPVAVKLLHAEHACQAETVARFRREARHAGSVSHPAITSIHDYGEAGPSHTPYLVMELVDGPSLEALLSAGPLDAARTMDVIAQAASGLDAAHMAGLVHRDVKPANLLLDRLGRVKITDFGIACIAGSGSDTAARMIVGTPAYLAPERVAGAPATPASDLYSLGVVAYECLAGHPPFTGAPLAVAVAHRDRPLPPLPDTVPAEVARLVAELTAKDPAARPGAGEVAARAARLRDALTGGAVGALSPGTGAGSPTLAEIPLPGELADRPRSRSARGRLAGLLLALAAAVALAGLVGMLTRGMPATTKPSPLPSHPAARVADVDMASFTGEPVGLALRRLRQLGFVVRVDWQQTGLEPAGTVVSVWPGGQVPAGSTVTLTGALPPPQVAGEHHGGGVSGNDISGHDGGGGGSGGGGSSDGGGSSGGS